MASSAKTCFLLFLILTITLSSHQILARDSQFFNKVPSSNNNNGVPEFAEPEKQSLSKLLEEEPNFIPENENNNGYGLYGHESGQLPPSTTNDNGVKDSFRPANAKYLPKNYNTEAYVTEPEGYTPSTTTTAVQENNNNNNNPFSIPNSKYLPKNYNTESYVTDPVGYTPTTATEEYHNENNNHNYYYNNGYQNEDQKQEYPTGANANNNYYGNGNRQQQSYNTGANNNYNSFAQRDYTTAAGNNNYGHYTNGAVNSNNGYQRQGMSDTRFLENGKYFHDVNLEKSTFNPNDVNTREFGYDNRGYYNNNNNNNNMNMNNYEYNNGQNYAGFQNNHNQFQNFQEEEEDMP